ncbi:MAG: hypothetical protein QOF72_3123 [Blastocatellia bacterium]|jgi:hypothetical protein|nr:hypothetical protein [Blastocatellia bacterium]
MKVERFNRRYATRSSRTALLPALKGRPKVMLPLRGKLLFRSMCVRESFTSRNRTIENCSRFALTGGRGRPRSQLRVARFS